jgi:hypothetical protein
VTKPNDKVIDAVIGNAEFKRNAMAARLNWLRAGVLGANDGIMSTSGLVLGVAASPGVSSSTQQLLRVLYLWQVESTPQ